MSGTRQRQLAIPRPAMLAAMRPAVAAGLGLALLLGGPLLAGCGTGQLAQTAHLPSAVDGAQGQIGPIAVRNVTLVFPKGVGYYRRGEDAPLTAVIVNTGETEDELTSARTPYAEAVQIEGQRTLAPQLTLHAIAPSTAAGQSTGGAELGQGEVAIKLVNLADDVRPGKTVPVTFLFRQAGELTLDVPIGPPALASATPSS